MKTAILGAGVSGLALARTLLEEGVPLTDLTIFEAAEEVGGLMGSKELAGFTYDVAGGHILYGRDQETLDWMVTCAGGEQAFASRTRQSRIRFGDSWVRYPFENGLGDLPPEIGRECLEAYIKAHEARTTGAAASTKGGPPPADFASWIRWRFGDGIAAHFMDPYNEKIWKRELSELTSDWVADRVPDAPLEDVIKASRGEITEGYTHQSVFRYPLRGGFNAISHGIASNLGPALRLSTPVRELRRRGEGWTVNGEEFDVLISTLPLTDLPGLLPELPGEVAEAMADLSYNSLVSILVALDHDQVPDYSWVYLPHAEQGPANRITYLSNYSPHNAPQGRASLLCEVNFRGGPAGPGEPDGGLEEDLLTGLAAAGLLERPRVLFTDRSVVRHAYVIFDHAYRARRAAALNWCESVSLHALGRFGRFEYDNSDACVKKARDLARTLAQQG
ncbi:MAG: FAD-dependent oxidoreductase [Planctomycetota bacterium]|jgi:protoporphyrinogen oxidase|nr:FAD-dependent oxidoreductase [Planctomycetota bacterium]